MILFVGSDTSPIQFEMLRPIHIGNKCSAAAEWPGGLSETCRDAGTDAGTAMLAVEALTASVHDN